MNTDEITPWALRKADEIIRQHSPEQIPADSTARLRDAIAEALIEAFGLGQEPLGDD